MSLLRSVLSGLLLTGLVAGVALPAKADSRHHRDRRHVVVHRDHYRPKPGISFYYSYGTPYAAVPIYKPYRRVWADPYWRYHRPHSYIVIGSRY